jgi:hypothetical protein
MALPVISGPRKHRFLPGFRRVIGDQARVVPVPECRALASRGVYCIHLAISLSSLCAGVRRGVRAALQ